MHSWLDWGENQQQVMQHCQVAIKENPAKNYILLLSRSKNSFPNLYCLHLTKTVCYINIAGWFYRALPPPVLIFLESDNKLNLDPPYVNHSWTTADRTTSLSLSVIKNLKGFHQTGLNIRQNMPVRPRLNFPVFTGCLMISSNQHVQHVQVQAFK